MADDDLLPTPTPIPTDRTPRPKDLRCGFCETTLTPGGEVMRLSERAKSLRDFEDDVEDLKADLAIKLQEIEQLKQQIADRDSDMAKLQADLKKAQRLW
jgi:peptidoglycan hydrolase CwlO-like protein